MSKWLFLLRQTLRQLWVRVAVLSVLGLVAALAAVVLAPFVPVDFALKIGTGAVDQVLSILASSMLAVATFSLATLVTAYTAISASTTPRAATLLVAGGRGQSALATFVGAFIYAVTGVFALQTGYYGAQGRVIIFFFTVGVLLAVITALIRWIDQLSKLGRVGEAIDRVAEVTRASFEAPLSRRGGPAGEKPPSNAVSVGGDEVGYVRNIDIKRLGSVAEAQGLTIFVEAVPGTFVHGAQPLLHLTGQAEIEPELAKDLRACWDVGDRRSFDQDPRFGMTVLGEIAAKALSPGINDPGTALDVISTVVRLLTDWTNKPSVGASAKPACLHFPAVSAETLLDDAFTPVAQFGAGNALVAARLQSALRALAKLDDAEMTRAANALARVALKRAVRELPIKEDRERVRLAARELCPGGR